MAIWKGKLARGGRVEVEFDAEIVTEDGGSPALIERSGAEVRKVSPRQRRSVDVCARGLGSQGARVTAPDLPAGCRVSRYTFTVAVPGSPTGSLARMPARVRCPVAPPHGHPPAPIVRDDARVWSRARTGFSPEPIPSSRDDAYIAATRWERLEDALFEAAMFATLWVKWEREQTAKVRT